MLGQTSLANWEWGRDVCVCVCVLIPSYNSNFFGDSHVHGHDVTSTHPPIHPSHLLWLYCKWLALYSVHHCKTPDARFRCPGTEWSLPRARSPSACVGLLPWSHCCAREPGERTTSLHHLALVSPWKWACYYPVTTQNHTGRQNNKQIKPFLITAPKKYLPICFGPCPGSDTDNNCKHTRAPFLNRPVCGKVVGLCVRTGRQARLSPGRCWTLERAAGQYTAETSKKHLGEKWISYY